MKIDGIGVFKEHGDIQEWLISEPLQIMPLTDKPYYFVIDYFDDRLSDLIESAMLNFKNLSPAAFKSSAPFIYDYYRDSEQYLGKEEVDSLAIGSPDDIWKHIQPRDQIHISIQNRTDPFAYASLECECAWEAEHGLQIVFRNGNRLCKIGPCDGHLTNEHAYGRAELRDRIYVSPSEL